MNLKENLILLRKEFNLSQEDLADKLKVSRQAVSKWEGGSLPETETLINISKLFNVSIDKLLKEELKSSNLDIGSEYKRHAKYISFGVFNIFIAVILLIIMDNYFNNDIGIIIFLILVFTSVLLFVYSTTKHELLIDGVDKLEKKNELNLSTLIGLSFIFIGVISLVIIENYLKNDIGVIIFLFLVSIGVFIFTYNGIVNSQYIDNTVKNERVDNISAAIMIFAVIIFFCLGFVFNAWHPGWVVFPVGGMLCGIVDTLSKND